MIQKLKQFGGRQSANEKQMSFYVEMSNDFIFWSKCKEVKLAKGQTGQLREIPNKIKSETLLNKLLAPSAIEWTENK